MQKVLKVIETIFGWVAMLSLFLGGFTVVGFLIALIIGGDIGSRISVFLYNEVFHTLICSSSVLILFGLLKMYLSRQKALSIDANVKKSTTTSTQEEN